MNVTQDTYFGAIPGLLGVSTNRTLFRGYVYGSPNGDETSEGPYPFQIHLDRNSGLLFDPLMDDPGFIRFGRYSLNPELREIRYSRKLYLGRHAQYRLNLEINGFSLGYNSTYERYSELIITMHPVPDHLASIFTYYKLMEHGFLTLHCSAVNRNDGTTAIFALPNTGKTQTAYKLVTEYGAKLAAEDISVYGDNQLYPCPFTRSGAYFLTGKTVTGRFWSKRSYAERLFDRLDERNVCLSGPVPAPRSIFILKPGEQTGHRTMSSDEAFSIVYRLNSCEFEGIARQALLDIAGTYGWPDLRILDEKRHQLTEELIQNCNGNLFEVTAPHSEAFADITQSI